MSGDIFAYSGDLFYIFAAQKYGVNYFRPVAGEILQCSKLGVHPAPCVHILAAGCTNFSIYAPGGCMVFPHYEYLYIGMCI